MGPYGRREAYTFEGGIREIDLPDIDAVYDAGEAHLHAVAAEAHGPDAAPRTLRRGEFLREPRLNTGRSEQ